MNKSGSHEPTAQGEGDVAGVAGYAGGRKKMPLIQIGVLAAALAVNAYTIANLFPYLGIMIQLLLGLGSTNSSGFYAGYIASAFTFGRFLSGYVWGHVADVWGRKPVVVISLGSIALLSVVFGASDSLAMAIAARFVLGLTNGMMSAARVMMAEICGQEHIVSGMAYLHGARGVGVIVGPAIGGMLALPADTYPNLFPAGSLFDRHPFLLPNLVGTLLALIVLPMVVFYLPETKNTEKARAKNGVEPSIIGSRRVGCQRNAINEHTDTATSESHQGTTNEPAETARQGLRSTRGKVSIAPDYYAPCSTLTGKEEGGGSEMAKENCAIMCGPGRGGGGYGATSQDVFADAKPDKVDECSPSALSTADCRSGRDGSKQRNALGVKNDTYGDDDGSSTGDRGWSGDGFRDTTSAIDTSSNADSSGNNGACIDGHTAEDAKAGPRRAQRETADSSSAGDGEGTAPTCGCGPDALINTRHVKMILVMICFMSMAGIGLDETFPLWALSTTNVGGLGWITSQIGQAFGIAGILVLVYNILVFPRLARRVGMVTVQRVGAIIVIPAVLAIPSLGTVSPDDRGSMSKSDTTTFAIFTLLRVVISGCNSGVMSSLMIASTSVVPAQKRGKLSGLFMTTESFGRFVAPAGFATIYAWSILPEAPFWADHHLVFTIFAFIYALVSILAWRTLTFETLKLQPPPQPVFACYRSISRFVKGVRARVKTRCRFGRGGRRDPDGRLLLFEDAEAGSDNMSEWQP